MLSASTFGQIGHYGWAEWGDSAPNVFIEDLVRSMATALVGLHALCTSWDSSTDFERRLLDFPSEATLSAAGILMTSLASEQLAHWPVSGDGFDEWYFFKDRLPPERPNAFCNTLNSLDSHANAAISGRCDLAMQLFSFKPLYVIGEGRQTFVLYSDAVVGEWNDDVRLLLLPNKD